MATFLARFVEIWTTFYSTIWSHWLLGLIRRTWGDWIRVQRVEEELEPADTAAEGGVNGVKNWKLKSRRKRRSLKRLFTRSTRGAISPRSVF